MLHRPLCGAILFTTQASLLLVLLGCFLVSAQAQFGPPTFPEGFSLENAAGTATFVQPVDLAATPDGRLFVVEKGGVVFVVENGRKLAEPLLDIADEVLNANARGLTALALDPDFAENGHLYVLHAVDPEPGTDVADRTDAIGRVVRYTISASDRNQVDPTSRFVVLDGIPACSPIHTPDDLQFASDGSLLVSTGDSAQGLSPGGLYPDCYGAGRLFPASDAIGVFRAQRLESLAGKILRVDPATGEGLPSNPFFDGDSASNPSRVWAYGLRNPFTFRLRPGRAASESEGPGTLYIGDVGAQSFEEINVGRRGDNFGWPCFEGPALQPSVQAGPQPPTNGCATFTAADVTPPTLWFVGTDSVSNSNPPGLRGDAIIVGDFYSGTRYPAALRGALFHADYVNGWVGVARFDREDRLVGQDILSRDFGGVVNMTYDPVSGWMYFVNIFTGEVLRLVYDGPLPPSPSPGSGTLPAPWLGQDVGKVLVQGGARFDPARNVLHLTGAGELGPSEPDAFYFVSRSFDGDLAFTARLDTLDQVGSPYARVGLMVRESTDPNAAYLQLTATTTNGLYFEWRDADGTYGTAYLDADALPRWVRLIRTGDTFSAAVSSDGRVWSGIGTRSQRFEGSVLGGFALTSDDVADAGLLAYARLSNLVVSVGPDDARLPAPWQAASVGTTGGYATFVDNAFADGTFEVTGGGDIWGKADDFYWMYQPLTGDGSIRARLDAVQARAAWAKAGLVLRSSLEREAPTVFLAGTPSRGLHLQHRAGPGREMVSQQVLNEAAPQWLRLDRVGEVLSAYTSEDGVAWTLHSSLTVTLPEELLVGLATTATDLEGAGELSRATFSDVLVDLEGGPQPHEIAATDQPQSFQLAGIYPNPFNPRTTVKFVASMSGDYQLEVFDLLGRQVHSDRFREESAIEREVLLDLSEHASGTYIVRVLHEESGYSVREKVVLLK
ncbi:MAG: PQQ-dependent sugar dehydrogenase [Bacteroidota bacterium]